MAGYSGHLPSKFIYRHKIWGVVRNLGRLGEGSGLIIAHTLKLSFSLSHSLAHQFINFLKLFFENLRIELGDYFKVIELNVLQHGFI